MSLTQNFHLFGGVSETGLDNFLDVFFTARPHLLAYGTPAFATNQNLVTLISTTSLPSFLSGLQALLQFTIPTVDIAPADAPGELLPPAIGQFTVFTNAELTVLCGSSDVDKRGGHVIKAAFSLAALCAPVVFDPTPGTGSIGVELLDLKIVGVEPTALEQIVECILSAVLRWALGQVKIAFNVFTIDGVSLTLEQGPLAQDDQVEVRGDIS
jgi:hypothetical protein